MFTVVEQQTSKNSISFKYKFLVLNIGFKPHVAGVCERTNLPINMQIIIFYEIGSNNHAASYLGKQSIVIVVCILKYTYVGLYNIKSLSYIPPMMFLFSINIYKYI